MSSTKRAGQYWYVSGVDMVTSDMNTYSDTLKGLHGSVKSETFFTKHFIEFHTLTVMHDVHLPPYSTMQTTCSERGLYAPLLTYTVTLHFNSMYHFCDRPYQSNWGKPEQAPHLWIKWKFVYLYVYIYGMCVFRICILPYLCVMQYFYMLFTWAKLTTFESQGRSCMYDSLMGSE